ncbi:thiamine phosphate synthase [Bacteroides sp. UBA939]|uniref:thiamine phosphate synthase n=1 Tax=Bacteroides sp. UBA939 TaxID=1946092 RepID=UPI0025BF81DE|nr:thiamine phosphate synthase [Bacteroides sp. UBA939]
MKLIVITSPDFLPDEARIITRLFKAGLHLLHVRKPDAGIHQVSNLLQEIPAEYRSRIVIHDFFSLKDDFSLGGIHLNARHPAAPEGYQGLLSRACHSLEEVQTTVSGFDYVLMSPVYDSISKQGYRSGYSQEALRQAQAAGIINKKVVALGGISATNLAEIKSLGFGGAALLGDIWNRYHTWDDAEMLLSYFEKLQSIIHVIG